MANGFTTYFDGLWAHFLDWFGSEEAMVVSEGKTIIDELVPVFKADLLSDGSALLESVAAALATGGTGGIVTAAEGLIPQLAVQGIALSREAATVAVSFISAKINSATATASASGTAS
jgi:hypothetical protein